MSTHINAFGNNTASEAYSLQCFYDPGIIIPTTFHWYKGSVDVAIDNALTVNSSSSLLHFSPLLLSHSGMYTCAITFSESNITSHTYFNLSVKGKIATTK